MSTISLQSLEVLSLRCTHRPSPVSRVLCSARHKGTNISNVHDDVKRENTHEQREERKDWEEEMKQGRRAREYRVFESFEDKAAQK